MQYAEVSRTARPVQSLGADARATFITRTYLHLFGAILAFTGIEVALFASGLAARMAVQMLSVGWLWILGAFMVASWLASRMAHSTASRTKQYAGLSLLVVAQAILFVPMLYIAHVQMTGVLAPAALVTLLGFTGLTMTVVWTGKDFSFMGSMLRWGGVGALLAIVAGAVFGFNLGMWFSVAMVVFAGGAILYDTSNVLNHYPEDRYVGASLELFASVALFFWYILRIFMSGRR